MELIIPFLYHRLSVTIGVIYNSLACYLTINHILYTDNITILIKPLRLTMQHIIFVMADILNNAIFIVHCHFAVKLTIQGFSNNPVPPVFILLPLYTFRVA